MLPGATAEQSACNLYAWLDTVASTLGLAHTFIVDANGTRVPGTYHNVRVPEEARFRSVLSRKMQLWQAEATLNNKSCGFLIEVGGGTADGRGGLTGTAVLLGPFQG